VLAVSGRWVTAEADALLACVDALTISGISILNVEGIESIDLTGAHLLRRLEARLGGEAGGITYEPKRPDVLAFVDGLGGEALPAAVALGRPQLPAVQSLDLLGRWAVGRGGEVHAILSYVGRVWRVFLAACLSPRRLRVPSVFRHVRETGIDAIPIVALIAFLISVIVAYIGAQELRQFGGEIFVVDLVTVSVLRELGVLLTAIIVAGRSGSSFAAELGVMQLNEEVDALRAIGLDPMELLVLPRILGLIIALPLLTVLADAMGVAGGAVLSWLLLDIPFNQFLVRMQEALAPTTFWAGVVKAPVFGLLIAMVGTGRGLEVRGTSRELGRLTTVAVVQSIFMVLAADALFAVLFWEYDF